MGKGSIMVESHPAGFWKDMVETLSEPLMRKLRNGKIGLFALIILANLATFSGYFFLFRESGVFLIGAFVLFFASLVFEYSVKESLADLSATPLTIWILKATPIAREYFIFLGLATLFATSTGDLNIWPIAILALLSLSLLGEEGEQSFPPAARLSLIAVMTVFGQVRPLMMVIIIAGLWFALRRPIEHARASFREQQAILKQRQIYLLAGSLDLGDLGVRGTVEGLLSFFDDKKMLLAVESDNASANFSDGKIVVLHSGSLVRFFRLLASVKTLLVMPHNHLGTLKALMLFAKVTVATALKVRIIFIFRDLDSDVSRFPRWVIERTQSKAAQLIALDGPTQELADINLTGISDCADPIITIPEENQELNLDKPLAGVVINRWKNMSVTKVAQALDALMDSQQLGLLFLPMSREDSRLAREIISLLIHPSHLLDCSHPSKLRSALNQLDLLITSRYEPLLFCGDKVPCLPIAAHQSVRKIAEEMGIKKVLYPTTLSSDEMLYAATEIKGKTLATTEAVSSFQDKAAGLKNILFGQSEAMEMTQKPETFAERFDDLAKPEISLEEPDSLAKELEGIINNERSESA